MKFLAMWGKYYGFGRTAEAAKLQLFEAGADRYRRKTEYRLYWVHDSCQVDPVNGYIIVYDGCPNAVQLEPKVKVITSRRETVLPRVMPKGYKLPEMV